MLKDGSVPHNDDPCFKANLPLCELMLMNRLAASIIIGLNGLAIGFAADAGRLKWENADGYRVAALSVPATGKPGFTLLAGSETGVHFTNVLSQSRILLNL